MILRRALLLLLVGICGCAVLANCTTPEVMCDMRDEQDVGVSPLGFRVHATAVSVVTQAELDSICGKKGLYGCNTGGGVFLRYQPRFKDVCSLAKFGHEMLHQVAQHKE